MADLQKVRVQLYDENEVLVGDVDVMTSADCVTFADGETFQQKLNAGKLKGDKGDTGATGAKGATGAAGAAATVKVGTVTTGAAGSQASVVNSGTSAAAIFDFTIPKGATGDKGVKGDTGAKGDKGDKGDTGATGQRGSQAFMGTGITGTSTTATVFSGSGVSSALVGDFYINTSTGNLYQCTVAGAASVAKWVYKGALKGPKGDTGATGAKGDKGDTGATGPKGDKGDPGDTIRVGTAYASATQRKIFFKVVG